MKHSNNVKESYLKNSLDKNKAIADKNISDNISSKKILLSDTPIDKTSFKPAKPSVLTSVLTSILIFLLLVAFFTVFSLTFTGCDSIANLTDNLSKSQSLEKNTAEDKNTEDIQQSKNTETAEDKSSDISSEDTSSAEIEDTEQTADSSETQVENTDETNSPKEIAIDPALQTINVYYSNNTGEYLVGEARDVEGSSKLVDAVYEMMKDPIDQSLVVLIPSTTKINSVKAYENGVAKIDLSQSFLDDRFQSDTVDILLVYSIVNTLTEFKEIQAVEFYIDGKKLDILGQLDIKDPIYRRSDLIKS